MKYILTQEEYDKLLSYKGDQQITPKQMQKLCTKIADTMPIQWTWAEMKFEPWGCILSKEAGDEWYCDDCPVQKICPHEYKEWSQ